jgi:protein-S-isoprenylcysteine O-methyltransferase Ste14
MFREKLIYIFYSAATGSSRTRILLTPIGPLVFFGFIAGTIAASLLVDRWLSLPGLLDYPVKYMVCVPLLIGGSFLTAWSVLSFLKRKGTPVPFNPPPELVVTGPYASSRNPMLTGLFLVLFGTGALLGSISMVLFFTPLFVVLMVWELKAVEEPELERRLGQDYIDYRKRVAMFVPGFKR